MKNFEENGVVHIINAQDNGLEFITMLEAGYSDFNILKDDFRQ